MFGMFTRRITYLIDSEKRILPSHESNFKRILLSHEGNFNMSSHAEKVMEALGSGEIR